MASKYYKSKIAGLSVVVGEPLPDEVAPQLVQFQQYRERFQGDEVKVGYLETDNEVAQKALSEKIPSCRENSKFQILNEFDSKRLQNYNLS